MISDCTKEELLDILESVIDNPYMGFAFIDTEGKVLVLNQTYCSILEVKREDVIGKHITEITPNTRLHLVLETGETDIADLWSVNGWDMVVTRMPIYRNGVMIGAMAKSLFLERSAAKVLVNKLVQVEDQLNGYKEEIKKIHHAKYELKDLVGSSISLTETKLVACQVAKTVSSVLITGETGTGKELMANAIHNASGRSRQPFIRVNCGALPNNLLESELFGYEEGAFTGAKRGGKPGKFELVNGGTVFLDEIGEMPLEMQTKLLTFLQDKEFERVGGNKTIKVDVRIIAATNKNLEEAAREGKFRQDLYYRLNVVNINIPPLRKRLEDIPELAEYLLQKLNRKLNTNVKGLSDGVIQLLQSHEWPGNVRELENLIERAIHVADMNEKTVLEISHFQSLARRLSIIDGSLPNNMVSLSEAVDATEKAMIIQSLKRNAGDKMAVAQELGIHFTVLYKKIKKYGITSVETKKPRLGIRTYRS
ncbi:MAG: sigma 54-interacting transcriptional regulator [Firmicutes bacterium]|nr:sigma 54-interacting transcriptional regulator [Bacillota bacterium]